MIQSFFNMMGFEIRRVKEESRIKNQNRLGSNADDMLSALHRIKDQLDTFDCIVDVGAAKGTWSQKANGLWPQANFILIEPLHEQIDGIPDYFKGSNRVKIYEAVAGKEEGHVHFDVSVDLDGSGIYGGAGKDSRQVKVVTLDGICPDDFRSILLKLDTHGYEIPIFEGAAEVLKRTTALIVEVYGFQVSPTGRLFHEISEYLAGKGFRLFDIVDIMRRPKDNAFWQADAIFLKQNNRVFQQGGYA